MTTQPAPLSEYEIIMAAVHSTRAAPPARHPDVKLLHQDDYIGADTLTPQRAEIARLRAESSARLELLHDAYELIDDLEKQIEELKQNAACVALSAGASGEPVLGQPSLSFPRWASDTEHDPAAS